MTEKQKRNFGIDLGLLIMRHLADGVSADEILKVLEAKVEEEKSIGRTRAAFERAY